jgi:hypothetical protein
MLLLQQTAEVEQREAGLIRATQLESALLPSHAVSAMQLSSHAVEASQTQSVSRTHTVVLVPPATASKLTE